MKNVRLISTATALIALVVFLSDCGANKVTVPNVKYKDPATAYDLLHKAGLKVSMRGECWSKWLAGAFGGINGCSGAVVEAEPQSGRRLARGSTVVIGVGPVYYCDFSGLFICVRVGDRMKSLRSPYPRSRRSLDPSQNPAQMPDLRGNALSAAVKGAGCLLVAVPLLPPLRAADKPHLYDNFVVVGQSPPPGSLTGVTASNPGCMTAVTVRVAVAK